MIEAMVIKHNGSFYQLLKNEEGINGCNKCSFNQNNCPEIKDGDDEVAVCTVFGYVGYFKEVK